MKIINKYFTDNYQDLVNLSKARCIQYKRKYDPAAVVSYAWEHCKRFEEEINCDTVCEIYARRFISKMIAWTTSPVNMKENQKEMSLEFTTIRIEEDDINEKLELEKWIQERKAVLELFRLYLKEKNVPLARVLELMLRGYNTSGLLSEAMGFSRTKAYFLILEVREELNTYKKRYNIK